MTDYQNVHRSDGPRRGRASVAVRPALPALALLVLSLLGLTGCGTSASSGGDRLLEQPVPDSVTVTTTRIPGLGTVLTDGHAHALYMFPPDAGSRVSCVGPCAGIWPPLTIADGHRPTATGQVNRQDLSTLADPNTGARVVTYAGYPLYRYSGDVRADVANGQALFNSGGPWYVLDADGQPVTTDPGPSR